MAGIAVVAEYTNVGCFAVAVLGCDDHSYPCHSNNVVDEYLN